MKQKRSSKIINRYILGVAALVVLAGVLFITVIAKPGTTEATPPAKPSAAKPATQFAFNKTPGWWQGATNKTSMAVFSDTQDCFVSIQHATGSISAQQAKRQKLDSDLVKTGHSVTSVATQTLGIATNSGTKQYQLEQMSVTNPATASTDSGDKVQGGQEFGYVALPDNSYLYIEGYCNTAAQLPTTIPALQAMKFDSSQL